MSAKSKIKSVQVNNYKKCIVVTYMNKKYSLPFSKLRLKPSLKSRIVQIEIDKELAGRAVTYTLENGKEDSLHIDAFLDYHKDPSFMRNLLLYQLTSKCIDALEASKLSKSEVARLLKTSRAQLDRLLDTANYSKSMDELIRLLMVLGIELNLKFKKRA